MILIVMATCVFALALSGGTLVWFQQKIFRDFTIRNLLSQAQITAMNIQSSADLTNEKTLARILQTLNAESSIVSGKIISKEGKEIATYTRKGKYRYADDVSPTIQNGGFFFSDDSLIAVKKIVRNGQDIATVQLESDLGPFYEAIDRNIKIIIASVLVAALAALFAASLLQTFISKPISSLTDVIKQVSQKKNYSLRAKKISKDETGILIEGFNEMLTQIQSRENELVRTQDILESKVKQRTAKLSAINRHLQNEIVERQQIQAKLQQAKNAAEKANAAKSEFLANMSHELRTPLHGILSFAQFGMKKHASKPEKVADYFSRIHQCGQTLHELLNDLLDLAKLESGKMDFSFRHIDLVTLTNEVIDEFRSLIDEKKISLSIKDSKPQTAYVDPDKIKQVIRNLLSNALKFSPQGGQIIIDIDRSGEVLTFSVADEGPGIPGKELLDVFDKFVQSSKTKSPAGGTGLGLAICREIIIGHSGRIHAANRQPSGAVVTFEIPVFHDRDEDILAMPAMKLKRKYQQIQAV